jgi:hypothetical protein
MEFAVVVDWAGIHLWSGRGELQLDASFGWHEMSSLTVDPARINLAPIGNGPVRLVIGADTPRGRILVAFRILVEHKGATTHREMNLLHFTHLFDRIQSVRASAEPIATVGAVDRIEQDPSAGVVVDAELPTGDGLRIVEGDVHLATSSFVEPTVPARVTIQGTSAFESEHSMWRIGLVAVCALPAWGLAELVLGWWSPAIVAVRILLLFVGLGGMLFFRIVGYAATLAESAEVRKGYTTLVGRHINVHGVDWKTGYVIRPAGYPALSSEEHEATVARVRAMAADHAD